MCIYYTYYICYSISACFLLFSLTSIPPLKHKHTNTQLRRTLDLEEQARIDKRKADKNARAAIRYAKLEAQERFNMEMEDYWSNKYRFQEWENIQISREREGMWYEECEQCATDSFWGFDVEIARLMAINEKYKEFYR